MQSRRAQVSTVHGRTTALAAIVLIAAGSTVAAAAPASDERSTIVVSTIPEGVFAHLDDVPQAEVWRRVPEYEIAVAPAPPVHQSIALRHGRKREALTIKLAAVSDRQRIYFRLRWRDQTRDVRTAIGEYRDGVALQFPLQSKEAPWWMGGPDSAVAIWYWRADTDAVEALVAEGPGTVHRGEAPEVSGAGAHVARPDRSEWTVVMSSALAGAGASHVPFAERTTIPMAIAVWQGHDAQRDGDKQVSQWLLLQLGGGR